MLFKYSGILEPVLRSAFTSPVLGGHPATPFIVAGGPRSGSTLLQTLINSHPNAICMHELLKHNARRSSFYRNFIGSRSKLLKLREQNVEQFIDEILGRNSPFWIQAIGFKALYTHPKPPLRELAWKRLGSINNLRVIWLSRNPVEAALSFAIAKETGKWVGKSVDSPVTINPDYLLRRLDMEHRASHAARLEIESLVSLELDYANLLKQRTFELSRIQKFLGLSQHQMTSPLRKQKRAKYKNIISNFIEIERVLGSTKWAVYFETALCAEREPFNQEPSH